MVASYLEKQPPHDGDHHREIFSTSLTVIACTEAGSMASAALPEATVKRAELENEANEEGQEKKAHYGKRN